MRKRRCSEPGCYGGTIYDNQGDERECPRCGGEGLVDDAEAATSRFKDPANIQAAEGFLKSYLLVPQRGTEAIAAAKPFENSIDRACEGRTLRSCTMAPFVAPPHELPAPAVQPKQ